MIDLLNSLLSSTIDYQNILTLIIAYFLALWLMFCLWVFLDAHKRYHKFSMALLMAGLVFVFNFPALVFYLIIRPEEDMWHEFVEHDGIGGVQVPVVKFTGEDGVVRLTLSMQIHPQSSPNSDMVVNVGWDSKQTAFDVSSQPSKGKKKEVNSVIEVKPNAFQKLQEKAKQSLQTIQQSMSDSVKDAEEMSTEGNDKSRSNHKKEA